MDSRVNKMSKKTLGVIAVLLLAAAGVALYFLLKASKPADTKGPHVLTVEERMNDPVYIAKLEKQLDKQKLIAKKINDARQAFLSAKAAGAKDDELLVLSNKLNACYRELSDYQTESQAIVRDQMMKEFDAKAIKKLQKKGN